MGETLRRLPWDHARVEEEQLLASLERGELAELEELPRDKWPGR
jgi:hypothetical protein